MSLSAFLMILSGGLQLIFEFGSITFIIVSFLMACSNFRKRKEIKTHIIPAVVAILGLSLGGILIFYYELTENLLHLIYIMMIYVSLILISYIYSRKSKRQFL